jgi:alkylation response protein AidB-like acyl-CoA dehydrogenase
LQLLLERATQTYDSGANPLEVTLPTAAARFAAVEVAEAALSAAGDAFGSRGFEPDIGILGFAQMVRVLKSTPISSPVMLNFVAEHHLGLPRSS